MKSLLKYCLLIWCWGLLVPLQAQYDVLIKGGTVIDPKNNLFDTLDVAIEKGVIVKISSDIDPQLSQKVIYAEDLLVVPGLIDIHTHVFVGETPAIFAGGFNSVSPDDFTFRAGITTVVDAGTSGWRSFPKFKETVIDGSKTRVLAFLNIVGAGMVGKPLEEDLDDMDIEQCVQTMQTYPQHIVGVKIGHYTGPQWEPFNRALQAAEQLEKPLFLECHLPQLPLGDLLTKMRPGDIFTHTYGAVDDRQWLLNDEGQIIHAVRMARDKGVYFDVGHGGGSFHYSLAKPALEKQFYPHSMGTDLHRFSMNAGMKDMLNVMTKFLNLGMDLQQVIAAATWNPARMILREDLGHLSVGTVADVALLKLRKGHFGLVDASGFRITGDTLLQAEMTIRAGNIVWDLNGLAAQNYEK